jgi:hypothetical protein
LYWHWFVLSDRRIAELLAEREKLKKISNKQLADNNFLCVVVFRQFSLNYTFLQIWEKSPNFIKMKISVTPIYDLLLSCPSYVVLLMAFLGVHSIIYMGLCLKKTGWYFKQGQSGISRVFLILKVFKQMIFEYQI